VYSRLMKPVTRAHRLAVLEAWSIGGQILPDEYRWAETGSDVCLGYPRYEALAQLLANQEQSDLSRLLDFFRRLGVTYEQWGSESEQFLKIKLGGKYGVGNFSPKFVPEMWLTFIFRGDKISLDYGVDK
jgi:hypothetical protein